MTIVETIIDGVEATVIAQDAVVIEVATGFSQNGVALFIQETEPTPDQTAGLSNWMWWELNPDLTLKTLWHGRPA